MPSSESQRHSPYQGLIPYSEADAPFFFGREKETRLITANLFGSPLTLLYGASGVGKSSVLRAGVAHQLRHREDLLVVVFNAWQSNPVSDLQQAVADCADLADHTAWRKAMRVLPADRPASLAEFLAICSEQLNRRLMIILDQFEEYFLYHPHDDEFAAEFARAVTQLDAPVSFLISIREDFYAKLDRFEGRIPALYDNYLRVEHLDRDAAREAIEKPISQYNSLYVGDGRKFSIERELLETVLAQIVTGRVVLGEAGRGVVDATVLQDNVVAQIETPFLQLVMTRLWDEELRARSDELRLETLNRLGGAENIVRTHLDAVMSGLLVPEQEIAASIFHYLVTPSGTKIAYTASDLAVSAKLNQAAVVGVLERLCEGDVRILRAVDPPVNSPTAPRYEVFHDVLAPAILTWRRGYSQAREREEAQRLLMVEGKRAIRLRLGIAVLAVLLIFMIGLTAYAFRQRRIAEVSRREADSQRQLAVEQGRRAEELRQEAQTQKAEAVAQRAEAVRQKDAAEAAQSFLATSNEALKIATQTAEEQKRLALQALTIAEGERLKTKEALNTVDEIDGSNAYYKAVLRGHKGPVVYAILSNDAQKVLTQTDENSLSAWKLSETGKPAEALPLTSGNEDLIVDRAIFSPDGRYVVNASFGDLDVRISIWDTSRNPPERIDQKHLEVTEDGSSISSLQFSLDEKKLLAVIAGGVKIWQWDASNPTLTELSAFAEKAELAAFSPDGRYVVTSDLKNLEVWDVSEHERPQRIQYRSVEPFFSDSTIEFSPLGTKVMLNAGDKHLRFFDWRTLAPAADFPFDRSVKAAAISPNEEYLVAATANDNKAQVFDLRNQRKLLELTGHTGSITDVDVSPDGKYIVTSSADKTARVWDFQGELIGELRGHTGGLNNATFDRHSRYVVTSSDDKTARVWDILGDSVQISSGEAEIDPMYYFDFDTGKKQQVSFYGGADVEWETRRLGPQRVRQLRSVNGARIVRVAGSGFEKTTFAQLQGLNYSDLPIDKLAQGYVFAVLTTKGNYAKVQVLSYDEKVSIRWVTHASKSGLQKQ